MSASSQLTSQDVAKVAKLANLSLTDSEIEKFTAQLAAIFDYINQLSEVDTSRVDPTARVNDLTTVTREDVIDQSRLLNQAEAVNQSPKVEKNMFVVKAVIDND